MIRSVGGSTAIARRVVASVVRLARVAWGRRGRIARRDALAVESLARAHGLSAAERLALGCIGPSYRERYCRAIEDGRRVSVGARLDRSEFARSLSRASRESHGFGAIYWGAATLAGAAPSPEADDANSGVRLYPFDESSEATYDATDDAEADSGLTPRVLFREPEARQ